MASTSDDRGQVRVKDDRGQVRVTCGAFHPRILPLWGQRAGTGPDPTAGGLIWSLRSKLQENLSQNYKRPLSQIARMTRIIVGRFVDFVDLERDSAMLKRAWHCSRCSLGSKL